MRITGYRQLITSHDWGRPVGDVNGVIASGITDVPIVVLETDEGISGVGVGSAGPFDRIFPALDGEDPRAVSALYDRMLAQVFKSGHQGEVFGAIGAMDMALWDLKAKAAGEPLWRLLGARHSHVPGYASGLDAGLDDDQLADLHGRFARAGFTAAKLKGGLDLERDRQRLDIVRDTLGTAHPVLALDVNESWNRKQAVRYLSRLEETHDLAWIEEPVRRWDVPGHRMITDGCRAAVATGENLTGLEQFTPMITAGAVDIVQTGSVWGITHFLRVAALAHAHALPVSPVAYNGNPLAHAAAAVPHHLLTEVQDLTFPAGLTVDQTFVDGEIVLGDSPGVGIVVDEAQLVTAPPGDGWAAGAGPHVRPERAGFRLGLHDHGET